MRIVNQSRSLLIVTLNSGMTLHLAPRQSSEPIDPSEIDGNAKIEKLRRAGIVSLVRAIAS